MRISTGVQTCALPIYGLRELIDAGPEAPIVAKLVEIVAEYDKALQTWLDSGWADEAASKALNLASQRIGMTAAITSRAQHDHRRTTQAAITAATDALAGSVGSTTASIQAVSEFRQLRQARSEEHTSEPQSLMRLSYDVFCLK